MCPSREVGYGTSFESVIDAFHVVGPVSIPMPFYIDERAQNSGIRITDEFSKLAESEQIANLPDEERPVLWMRASARGAAQRSIAVGERARPPAAAPPVS